MKAVAQFTAALLCASATIVTAAATLQRRQDVSNGLPGMWNSPIARAESIKPAAPRHFKDAKRTVVRYGPFTLPARSKDGSRTAVKDAMDPNGFIVNVTLLHDMCKDCTVLVADADFTFEDGQRVDLTRGIYLHHLLMYNRCKTQPDFAHFCPINGVGAVAGKDPTDPLRSDIENPFRSILAGGSVDQSSTWFMRPGSKTPSGYYIKNDAFNVQGELINYSYESKTIYLTLDYEYMDGKYGNDAMVTMLSVKGCDMQAGWQPTSKKSVTRSGDFPVYQDGTIIDLRGHLHDGGTVMELMVNGRSICNSTATYGEKEGTLIDDEGKKWETISKMSLCEEPVKVVRGDKLSMIAYYDTEMHPLRHQHGGHEAEEMGDFSYSFVPKVDQAKSAEDEKLLIKGPPFNLAPVAVQDPLCAAYFAKGGK